MIVAFSVVGVFHRRLQKVDEFRLRQFVEGESRFEVSEGNVVHTKLLVDESVIALI